MEPYRLVSWQRRWYLVGRTARTDAWSTYRLDWIRLRTPGGPRFTPVDLPGGDYTAFVLRDVAFAGWSVHTRIRVDAPADEVLSRINPAVGVVEAVDDQTCVLVTGGDSVEIIAVYIGMLGLDFTVDSPPELVAQLAVVGERYRRAVAARCGLSPSPRPAFSGLAKRHRRELHSGRAYVPLTIDVLRITGGAISEMVTFHDDQLPRLGLPERLADGTE